MEDETRANRVRKHASIGYIFKNELKIKGATVIDILYKKSYIGCFDCVKNANKRNFITFVRISDVHRLTLKSESIFLSRNTHLE